MAIPSAQFFKCRRKSFSSTHANPSMPEWMRKHLNPATPAFAERLYRFCIPAHDSAPRGPIHPRFPLSRSALGFESFDVDSLRHTIQRHVDQRRNAPGRRGTSGSPESFPLRASGLVDMNMRIDQAGQQHGIAKIVQVSRPGDRPSPALISAIRPSSTTSVAGPSPCSVSTRVDRKACAILCLSFAFGNWKSRLFMSSLPNPEFLRRAIALATENVVTGKGGPFAAVIVRDGQIVGEGANSVTATQ